jgi:hypothetical protein
MRLCFATALLLASSTFALPQAPVDSTPAEPAVQEIACEVSGEPVCGYDLTGERVSYANLCRAATAGATDVTGGLCELH